MNTEEKNKQNECLEKNEKMLDLSKKERIEKIQKLILETCLDEFGDIDLTELDFGDNTINISGLKARSITINNCKADYISQEAHVAKFIWQSRHECEEIYQVRHRADIIFQNGHIATRINQSGQNTRYIYPQRLDEYELMNDPYREKYQRIRRTMTLEEIEKYLGFEIVIVNEKDDIDTINKDDKEIL